jgi:hypothetical protein
MHKETTGEGGCDYFYVRLTLVSSEISDDEAKLQE